MVKVIYGMVRARLTLEALEVGEELVFVCKKEGCSQKI
jgi:hypothetical protein